MQQRRDHSVKIRLAVGQGGDHCLVAAVCAQRAEQPVETAQQIRTAGNDQCKDGGDHSTLFDVVFALDGIELVYHLGQTPGAK